MALSQLEEMGMISTKSKSEKFLAQTGESEIDNLNLAQMGTVVDNAPSPDMTKYLEIARQLVKLDKSLPTIKLCIADVQAGKYSPSNAS